MFTVSQFMLTLYKKKKTFCDGFRFVTIRKLSQIVSFYDGLVKLSQNLFN